MVKIREFNKILEMFESRVQRRISGDKPKEV
jgi:hypothetical protein